MIANIIMPSIRPLCAKLHFISETYGVTPLSYYLLLILTFSAAPICMLLELYTGGLWAFVLHFLIWTVFRFGQPEDRKHTAADSFHIYTLAVITTFAIVYGVSNDYGLPLAFLFMSWVVLALANLAYPDKFSLIGVVEIGAAVVVMAWSPAYIPAIAILFGLTCFVSAGVTWLLGMFAKA